MAEALPPSTCRYPHRTIQLWRGRVQEFYDSLISDARPITILRKMDPPPNFNDPVIEIIMNLERDNSSIAATEKLLDYLISEEGLDPGRIAERWRAFDRALKEVNPLLYDIVTGKFDPDVQKRQRNLVNSFMDEICSQVDPIRLLPDLISRQLLGEMETECLTSIKDNKGRTMAASYMVSQLHRCGTRDWLKTFLDVLKKNGHGELAIRMSGAYDGAFKGPLASSPQASSATTVREASRGQGGSSSTERPEDKETGKILNPHDPRHSSQAAGDMERTRALQSCSAAQSGARPKDTQHQPAQNAAKPLEQECPGCGKMFKQLSRHVCKAADTASNAETASTTSSRSAQSSRSQEQECPGCGKMFKQISRHVCKAADTASTAETASITSSRSAQSSQSKEQECPGCGKMFKQLSRHVCKAADTASTAETTSITETASTTSSYSAQSSRSQEQECPGCGKMFKQLSRHVCKVHEPGTTTSQQPAQHSKPQEQQCPGCGKMFKQISRHVCKAVGVPATTTTTSSVTGGPTASGGARPKSSPAQAAAAPAKPKVPCPFCGKMFIRLNSHVCKAPAAAAAAAAASSTHKEQRCLKCGKMFNPLSRHKC